LRQMIVIPPLEGFLHYLTFVIFLVENPIAIPLRTRRESLLDSYCLKPTVLLHIVFFGDGVPDLKVNFAC